MKKALLLCLLATTAYAQKKERPETDGAYYSSKDAEAARRNAPAKGQEAEQPFKGANTIIIHSGDSPEIAFKNAGKAVILSGYSPTEKDNDLLYMLTGFRPLEQGSMLRMAVRISVSQEANGAAISFTSTFASAIADMWVRGATPMTARTEYRGAHAKVWAELMRVASSCQCGQMAFANQP